MKIKKLFSNYYIALAFILLYAHYPTFALTALPSQTNVAIDRVWKIKFSLPVDESSLQGIIVLDPMGGLFSIQPLIDPNDPKVVLVKHSTSFANTTTYNLIVCSGVRSVTGQYLSDSTKMAFSTVDPTPIQKAQQ
jgi:hypothetical protein